VEVKPEVVVLLLTAPSDGVEVMVTTICPDVTMVTVGKGAVLSVPGNATLLELALPSVELAVT